MADFFTRVFVVLTITLLTTASQLAAQSRGDVVNLKPNNFGDEFLFVHKDLLDDCDNSDLCHTSHIALKDDIYWALERVKGELQLHMLPVHWSLCEGEKCYLHTLVKEEGNWGLKSKKLITWIEGLGQVYVLRRHGALTLFSGGPPKFEDRYFSDSSVNIAEKLLGEKFNSAGRFHLSGVFVGRYDLNGDNIKELFVYYYMSPYCGTIGCRGSIYQRGNGRWVEIGWFHSLYSERNSYHNSGGYLRITENVSKGYKTLQTPVAVLTWDGGSYDRRCLYNCN